ncbi:MAG: Unknown protein [uncultured Sulfurovum sp.]|uniref:Tetratricopeptide repeat protein n=1 Tax=uncultured Sulfurovum sp. TaxID=269237 RepID=A0A6S6TXU3_9BACT|nr:MAG: Unknown protein [uncultured Sulfurovum sp.]
MMKQVKYLPLLLALSLTSLSASNDATAPTVDHMSVATMMIFDGKFEKAREELDEVDQTAPNFNGSKYFTMLGVMDVKEKKYSESIVHFNKAVEATTTKVYAPPPVEKKKREVLFSLFSEKEEPVKPKKVEPAFDAEKIRAEKLAKLHINLSKSYYKLKDYANTIKSLDNAGEKGSNKAGLFTLRAECYWKLKDHNGALEALSRGSELFPDDKRLLKQKFYYFAELKLYQAAIEASKAYMALGGASDKEYTALAQMLMSGGELESAIRVLEEAKLLFPETAKLSMILGHAYLKRDMIHVTADLFEQASYYDSKYTKEAAEMHRRAENLPHAIYLNSKLSDKKEKIKQKVAIFVDRGEYEKVIGLKDGLGRYGLLSDDNLRYALAYAYFMVKDYDHAEKHFKKITDNSLFSKATVIRKSIEKCKNNSLECI